MWFLGALAAAFVVIVLFRPFLTSTEPRAKRELRPVRKLATDDPLAPLLGGSIAFPPDPDEDGHDLEHHLVIDPAELRDPPDEVR